MSVNVVAVITAKPGSEDAVRAALEALVAPTRAEAGCLSYDLSESVAAPAPSSPSRSGATPPTSTSTSPPTTSRAPWPASGSSSPHPRRSTRSSRSSSADCVPDHLRAGVVQDTPPRFHPGVGG